MYNIHLLPALFGDAILIEYGTKIAPKYILIDGGPYFGFTGMIASLKKVAPKLKTLELLVVTHIDIDHIDGIITLLNQPSLPFKIKQVWFNGWEQLKDIPSDNLGVLQGEYLSLLIKKNKLSHNTSFKGQAVMVDNYEKLRTISFPGGMELTLLSPGPTGLQKLKANWKKEMARIAEKGSIEKQWKDDTRYATLIPDALGGTAPDPDTSIANGSSIAFIATCQSKSCLFAGDTPTAELLKAIDPLLKKKKVAKLKLDAWKLAHHGSKGSTLAELMKKIDTGNILISTNGDRYHHPDKVCIDAVLKNLSPGINLYFNYLSTENKMWDKAATKAKKKYTATYPGSGDGISIAL